LIQVLRIVIVDGAPGKTSQVSDGIVLSRAGKLLGLFDRGSRKIRLQSALEHGFTGKQGKVNGM
jgi:hypothetical protein